MRRGPPGRRRSDDTPDAEAFVTSNLRTATTLLLALTLLACGGGGAGEEGKTTLHLVMWRPDGPDVWEEVLAEFEEAHPGLVVEREIAPNDSGQFHALLTQKLRNRQSRLDVYLLDVVWTPEFARAGWLVPLDERFPPEEREAFFPATIEADTVGDNVWAVPLNTDAGVLYYRKDLLAHHDLAPPRTWPELVRQARLVTRENPGLHGYSAQFEQYEGLVCNMLELVASNGGDLLELTSEPTRRAVRFARDELLGGPLPRGALTWREQQSLDVFAGGGAVFHRNWPYAWSICRDSPAVAGKVGIAPLPSFEGHEPASALGGWRVGISAFSEHPEEAWALVSWMTSREVQKRFAVRVGKAPARIDLYRDPEVLAANPHFAALLPVFRRATPRPRTPVYPQVSNILQRALHAAVSGSAEDLDALLARAERRIDEARLAP